ncbi:MAG: glycosyltransferase family 4 protein [Micrococcales bacterium]
MTKRLINGAVLYFDARYIRVGQHDGISRFSAGLLTALFETHQVIAIISDDRQLAHLPAGIKFEKLNDPTDAIAELSVARKLNALGAKLVYSPMQTMGIAGRKFKVALTLHDLIYYRHKTPPASFNWAIKLGWRIFHLTYMPQRLLLNRADAVVTVSETTKSLMKLHRLTKKPIRVVYNAGSSQTVTHARNAPATKALVYMGSFMAYKNVETLVRALPLLEGFELRLLSRISPKRRADLLNLAGGNAHQISFLDGVTDSQYENELDNAFALVSASLDEGFGIPLIESMERATPVVVSDLEIFREVGGKAAHYFEASNAGDFAAQIKSLSEPATWAEASKASLDQAQRFSWRQSADALVAALESL